VTLLLWLVFYPGISLSLAFNATIIIPARLVASGDARYLDPDFLLAVVAGSRGLLKAITAGAAVAATMVVWMLATPSRYGRWLAAACVAAGGLLPLLLWPSERPGRDANLLALTLFVLTCSVVLAGRSALGQSPQLRAAATFGLAAAAFGHYFWSRADTSHMALVLALALAGAALLLVSLPVLTGLGLLSLFLFIAFCVERSPVFPAVKLFEHGVVAKIRPWRCTVFPADARDAVAFADAQANPGSCFVAVGSSQAWSSANPTELFLISSRLPYTRWYHYDPGLQSSPAVQAEMERELEASDSRTAVVWRADQFLFDQKLQNLKARSHFDAVFDRLYPITAARFGDYEVRVRSSGSRDVPLPAAEAP
jgi:hypothetical protein